MGRREVQVGVVADGIGHPVRSVDRHGEPVEGAGVPRGPQDRERVGVAHVVAEGDHGGRSYAVQQPGHGLGLAAGLDRAQIDHEPAAVVGEAVHTDLALGGLERGSGRPRAPPRDPAHRGSGTRPTGPSPRRTATSGAPSRAADARRRGPRPRARAPRSPARTSSRGGPDRHRGAASRTAARDRRGTRSRRPGSGPRRPRPSARSGSPRPRRPAAAAARAASRRRDRRASGSMAAADGSPEPRASVPSKSETIEDAPATARAGPSSRARRPRSRPPRTGPVKA